MLILAFESSCDETAVAVVRDGREVLSDAILSQADMHAIYGGVVPEILCNSTWEAIQSVSTSLPSRTTATAVSSQEDSIARIFIAATPFAESRHLLSGCGNNSAFYLLVETPVFDTAR